MSRAAAAAAWLATAAAAWDVRTPTNRSCLGGCACAPRLRACVPTAPSKDMSIFARSLASLAAHGVDLEAIHVVSRASASVDGVIAKANAARARGRPADFVKWLDEAGGAFPFDYASRRADVASRKISPASRGRRRQPYFAAPASRNASRGRLPRKSVVVAASSVDRRRPSARRSKTRAARRMKGATRTPSGGTYSS